MHTGINMRILVIIFFLLGISFPHLCAQSSPTEEWIESLLANNEEDIDLDLNTILDQIYYYQEHPLNLNKASREDFEELFFLTDIDIQNILNHKITYGNFLDPLELQSVRGLTIEKIKLLHELTFTGNSLDSQINRGILRDQSHELYLKWRRILEPQRGFSNEHSNPFLGDPNKLYMRYRYMAGKKIQLGFTAEKDAGEEFFRGSNPYGFDFYSAHLSINNPTRYISKLIVGDYSVSLGQGLIAFMGFGAGKSTQVMRVKNRTQALRPYTSVSEFNFMRGAAAELKLHKNIDLIVFGSHRNRDANFQMDTLDNNEFTRFTSLPLDGFHRTQNEINKKNQITLADAGLSLKYRSRNLTINTNTVYSQFSSAIDQPTALYRKFSSLQPIYFNNSIDYGYIWKNINIFGEVATDKEGDLATVQGLIMGLDRNLEISLVYRNLQKDYHSIYSNAFTESSLAQNEEGIYMGMIWRFNRKLNMHAYMDLFRHPWLRFRVNAPSYGREYFLRFNYIEKRKSDTYVQYFFEQKEQTLTNNDKIRPVVTTTRHRFRIHSGYKINPVIELRSRVEFSIFNKDNTNSRGFMAYQDIIFKPENIPLSVSARYAIFDTDNYDSRIYAFENDLLFEFSIPAYFNRGSRTYLNLRYRINRNLTAECRIAQTFINNQESIGSGLDEIAGNKRTDVKAQLRFKF